MERKKFINEIGNKIVVRIKKKNGRGTNHKTKETKKYQGVSIALIGPTSMSENEITNMEAVMIYKCLKQYLEKNKLL